MNPEVDYFSWLKQVVSYPTAEELGYELLLKQLYQTEFRYFVSMDSNQAAHGVGMRQYFMDYIQDCQLPEEVMNRPCSVLEMMVALAKHCEDFAMHNTEYGDRTHVWFWSMIANAGLDQYTDSSYDQYDVMEILDIFITRHYNKNGSGGNIFVVQSRRTDMRKLDLWSQMWRWIEENYTE